MKQTTKVKKVLKKGVQKKPAPSNPSIGKKPSIDIEVKEGLPKMRRTFLSEDDYEVVHSTLKSLTPNKRHIVVSKRFKHVVLNIVKNDFPEFKIRTSLNKEKDTVSIWRTK